MNEGLWKRDKVIAAQVKEGEASEIPKVSREESEGIVFQREVPELSQAGQLYWREDYFIVIE